TAGTIYYWRFDSPPHRLYVKSNEKEMHACLPDEKIECVGAHGNAVYFASKGKVYKAVFSPPTIVNVSYLRDQYE
ncbi:hypothetical protein PMAYCL1PPCAC_05622, partial [Pristionchus mayeri]